MRRLNQIKCTVFALHNVVRSIFFADEYLFECAGTNNAYAFVLHTGSIFCKWVVHVPVNCSLISGSNCRTIPFDMWLPPNGVFFLCRVLYINTSITARKLQIAPITNMVERQLANTEQPFIENGKRRETAAERQEAKRGG